MRLATGVGEETRLDEKPRAFGWVRAALKSYRYILALAAFVLSLAILWTLSRPASSRWFSDPAQPRKPGAYTKVVRPPQAWPALDKTILDSLQATTNAEGIEFRYQPPSQADLEPPNLVLERVAAGSALRVGAGSLSLEMIGIVYTNSPPPEPDAYGTSLPIQLFRVDGQVLTAAELSALGTEVGYAKLDYHWQFPEVRFLFASSNTAPMKVLGLHLFDARTQREIGGGSYSHNEAGAHHYSVELEARLWHQAPVEFVLDVAHGPLETFALAPVVGQSLMFGERELRLLAIVDGGTLGMSWSSMGGPRSLTTAKCRSNPAQIGKETSFIFALLPNASSIPLSFEAIDSAGKPVPSAGSSSSGILLSVQFRAGLNQIKQLRLTHFPHLKRGVFSVPFIPGMPGQNRPIRNLFDVQVPFSRISSEYEFERLLSGLLQTDLTKQGNPVFPVGYFPRIVRDVTARDLLVEYLDHFPRQFGMRMVTVKVNPQTQGVEIAPTLVGRALSRLGKFLK